MYSKVKKFICTHRNSVPVVSDINPDERFRDKPAGDTNSEYLGMKGKSDNSGD